MEEPKETEELAEVLRKLNLLLDEKNGLKVSGNGIICENTKKIIEHLEKIDKKLFFMEKRQQEWYEKEHPEAKKNY